MTKRILSIQGLAFLFILTFSLQSCNDDSGDDGSEVRVSFELEQRSSKGGDGEVTFEKMSETETLVTVSIDNDQSGQASPCVIRTESYLEDGTTYITLNPVINGESQTTITRSDDGALITYEQLIEFDGSVDIYESENDLDILLAQGDIGINIVTGESITYTLEARSESDVKGEVTFFERVSGEAKAVFNLEGTTDGTMHPCHIHANNALEAGPIILTFTPVDGTTGLSETHISLDDDGRTFVYQDVKSVDGYINVHFSPTNLDVAAQTDIGINALSGEVQVYSLSEVDGSGVTGELKFFERLDGSILAELKTEGGVGSVIQPAIMYSGAITDGPGVQLFSFSSIDGALGLSLTNIVKLDNGDTVNFESMKTIDAHVVVQLSQIDATVVAAGDIGINAN